MTLNSLVNNQFENIKVGYVKKEKLVLDHLQKMKGDTINGQLDGIIAETEPLSNLLSENTGVRQIVKGEGKGHTIIIKGILNEFIDEAVELETMCKLKFKKNSPEYLEAIPNGISEYQNATQAELPSLLKRLINFSEKQKAKIGVEYNEKFKDINLRWYEENLQRRDTIQESQNTIPDLGIIWSKLSKQMQRNCYTILLACPDNPEKLFTYFDFNIVNSRHHTADGSGDTGYKLLITALTTKAADISFSAEDTLLIINNGNKSIFYYAAATADAPQPATMAEIVAGDEAEVTALSLGAPANKFLIFVNKDAAESVEVEIVLI